MIKVFFLMILFIFSSGAVQADVLYLKSGAKVEGKILEETGYSYKMDVNGVPAVYYQNEVEKVIKGDAPQEGPAPVTPSQDVLDTKKELILRLLEANGSRRYMAHLFSQIISEVPEKNRALAKDVLKVEEIVKRVVPIYAKYYSEEELKEIISFYSSPVGAKHLQNTPKVMEDTMREVAKYFDEKMGKKQP